MKYLSIYIAILSSFLLLSCEDIIQMDLPEGDKMIIINGLVTDSLSVYADIMETVAYNEDGPNPTIDGAVVLLYENGVEVSQLNQTDTTQYKSPFIGSVGKFYYIEVRVPSSHPSLGGTVWRSQEEELQKVSPIDSIYQEYLPEDLFQEEGRYVFYHFKDPVGLGNRYRGRIWVNDSIQDQPGDIFVFEDNALFDGRNFNGEEAPAFQINGRPAPVGKKFKVEHTALSKAYFEYLSLLREQTAQIGGLFDPPPALLTGNIVGVTNPERTALGYFGASGVSQAEYTVVE